MRTVLGFEPFGDGTVLKLREAPVNIPGLGTNELTDVTDPGGTITSRGEALLERLRQHPVVSQGLNVALAQPPTARPEPLYLHMVSNQADQLPWEQLRAEPQGFIALDARWPIARIAAIRSPVDRRTFTPPLNIVAVLSAAQRSGVPQLQALLAATALPDARAVDTHLHVITAEQAVLKAVESAGRSDVSVEQIASTAPELAKQITGAKPHIIHLLCHGGASGGVRTLAFAHTADFVDDETLVGSVPLKLPDLVVALVPCAPWLVVLGACQTAQASETLAPAHELVSQGLPAVAGMRRLIDLNDTDRFCAALYPEVLATVRIAVADTREHEIDWATTFTAPRQAMAQVDPTRTDAWSDPVLYVQDSPLRIQRIDKASAPAAVRSFDMAFLQGQLDTYERFRAILDAATTDLAVLTWVHARIDDLRSRLAGGKT
ncbi:CHAT domain-containing protein [Embleya sp. NBC_00896]|uniref:CHAT domain-containing protein n=1 Tax=Embleya sp. NBC_00896 TaxID=2975961 RepID=UPI002F910B45|nr:CHAT domain-containing protein [Embleya sp. NBC_00896]